MKKALFTTFIFLLFSFGACGIQREVNPTDSLFFRNGNRICFVGNSITNNGEFHHNIYLFHLTRYPQEQITFFNCGISGDVTGGILKRMDDDILINNPTHAVIMIGMNDVRRNLYGQRPTQNADTLRMRREAIDLYKQNLEKIIEVFLSKNIRVILQKPSIYDQTGQLQAFNNFGVNDALKACADYIEIMAAKYKLPVVDYWTIMTNLNTELQKSNPSATLTSKDRVHPESTGHLVMAYQFLKTEKLTPLVSKIIINAKTKKLQANLGNCLMNNYLNSAEVISFDVKELSLPFPVAVNQQKALDLVPFMKELNMEYFRISNLKPGEYEIKIDNTLIGTFNHKALDEGINLAEIRETPQYQQSLKVRTVLEELWKLEANLRGLKFIEYNPYFKSCPDKENLATVQTYLDSVFTAKYDNPYYKLKLGEYIKNKPFEAGFKTRSDSLRNEAIKAAQPVVHHFEIRRKKA